MGLSPDIFWTLTPYQFNLCAAAHNEKTQYDHNMTAWGMWTNAMLTGVSGKKFPPLKKFLFGYNESQDKRIDEDEIKGIFSRYQQRNQ